ncbi:MAG TPA: transcriptional repressor [bacterium]
MDIDIKEKLQAFKKCCHGHGLRITPQRIAIYKKLSASDKHPSATEIYRQIKNKFPSVSLGTVNSTLITFTKIGLARIVEASGDPKRFDPDTKPHHHFRCLKCSRIIDFYNTAYDNIKVPEEIAEKCFVSRKKVYLEGLCDRCRNKAKACP